MKIKNHLFICWLILGVFSIYSPITLSEIEISTPNIFSKEERLNNLSQEYLLGNYTRVIESSLKLMQLDPKNETVMDLYALSNFKIKNYKAIIEMYGDTQAEYMSSPLHLKLRSISQARENNYYSASLALKTLRRVEPINSEWRAFYHYLVFKLNPESAFKELKRMNKAAPNITNDLNAGKLHQLEGNYEGALESFNSALSKDFLNKEAIESLGDTYSKLKKYDKAISAYTTLMKILPNKSTVRMKMAQTFLSKGQFLDAIKILENDDKPEVLELKTKLKLLASQFFNNEHSRSIAEEKIDLNDTLSSSEEKFFPKEIDIYAESIPRVSDKGKLVVSEITTPTTNTFEDLGDSVKTIHAGDVSIVELALLPKAKKYELRGVGFNAKVDYSSGAALNLKYSFVPENRNWEAHASGEYSRIYIKNLSGVTPNKTTLTNAFAAVGVNYLKGSFSVGPVLIFESMSAVQTSPSTLRGNVDFFNVGIKTGYIFLVNKSLKFKVEANYFSKIVTTSKTTAVGNVDSHTSLGVSGKIYFEMRPHAYYFAGVGFSDTSTKYAGSAARGTSQAIENEKDISFPLGINYAF